MEEYMEQLVSNSSNLIASFQTIKKLIKKYGPLQMNSYQSTKLLSIFEIWHSTTPYTSPIVHKVFSIPSLCNDIATLLICVSFICVFLVNKYEPTSHKRIRCIMTYTGSLLEYFSVKEPNNNLDVDPTFLSNAHTLWSLIFIFSKQMLKIMVFSHSPLSVITCISSICYTI